MLGWANEMVEPFDKDRGNKTLDAISALLSLVALVTLSLL